MPTDYNSDMTSDNHSLNWTEKIKGVDNKIIKRVLFQIIQGSPKTLLTVDRGQYFK